MMKPLRAVLISAAIALLALPVAAQTATNNTLVSFSTPQLAPGYPIVLTPISATAAVNNATTLTIPAPPGGQYNYVCYLAFEVGQDGTGGTAQSDSVTTSTNFNAFALKFSLPSTASLDTGLLVAVRNEGVSGCAKSTSPGTATTFIGPTANLHAAQTWLALYYQAP